MQEKDDRAELIHANDTGHGDTLPRPSFTPGPWCVKRRETSLVVRQRVFGRIPPKSVASVARRDAANAHLIAAAPDLYAAVKMVLDWFAALESEQWERTGPSQTLESAAENWNLPSDVPSLDMTPLKIALAKANGR